jgi:DNA-binding response OmpR family regulator
MANRPRVLVADADPGIRRLLQRHFGKAGYSVSTADLGCTVFGQLRHNPPDVIILATEMGDLEGVDLVSRVHAATRIPLLALTAPKGSATPHAILDAGADDCLDEPFLLEELAARTRRLLYRAGVRLERGVDNRFRQARDQFTRAQRQAARCTAGADPQGV